MTRILLPALLLLATAPDPAHAQPPTAAERARWSQRAARTEVVRDRWGIPHVYGKTDADAVFGLIYAQCEDDFPRVEMNYIEKLGRLAEVNGPDDIWKDLYVRMLIDSAEAVADYRSAPAWLRELLDAWADGINLYLDRHPGVRPALLRRFKPWYPLLWTDGSIGAISTGHLGPNDVRRFYAGDAPSAAVTADRQALRETLGSNGFAIAPSRTASGHAMLYINPHTTFYFRPEVQMVSGQGLNAYGAVTWGQFFIYQGFNEHCGWMHTSSNADVADVYAERIVRKDGNLFYRYDGGLRRVRTRQVVIRYRDGAAIRERSFPVHHTHHGPVMGLRDADTWLSVRSYNRARNSLEQSWLRTKARGHDTFRQVMALRGNTSNNTVFADAKGNIAYWHGNYMPRRDTAFDWGRTVDGTTSRTEWKGLHAASETVQLHNPPGGWIQNCNSTPFTAAGAHSPDPKAFPPYMAPDGENFRGVNAVRVLDGLRGITLDQLIAAGYDTRLAAFETLIPALARASRTDTTLSPTLAAAIDTLLRWDMRSSAASVATTLAVEWGQRLNPLLQRVYIEQGESDQVTITRRFAETARRHELLAPLQAVIDELQRRFGRWQMPWGEVNRYQRLTGRMPETYDDNRESLPVGFTSATWGCLPAYVSRTMPGTIRRYGVSGNSFVCAVEFGPKVRARSVLAGGVSNDPDSPHFADQAAMYTQGRFKDVLFYREDVLREAEACYRPGEPRNKPCPAVR
jgi:acyl-homoserine lactone acylase PvdQ